MSTPIAVTADDVVVDVGGCQHHERHRLGCGYCNRNRDAMLRLQRERQQLAAFIGTRDSDLADLETQIDAYYEDVAEQYNAGLDT